MPVDSKGGFHLEEGARVTGDWEPASPGPLQQQCVLLLSELSLQAALLIFCFIFSLLNYLPTSVLVTTFQILRVNLAKLAITPLSL